MGFGCLLGHDFDAPEHEQERERRGSEVIVTTREVKTCRDCGARQVLTENTAIKGLEADGRNDADRGTSEPAAGERSRSGSNDDAGIGSETDDGDDGWSTAVIDRPNSGGTGAGRAGMAAEEPTVTHDAVILTDDEPDGRDEREPGEWPEFRNDDANTAAERNGRETDESETEREPTDGPVRLRCDGCSRAWDPERSSLIPGDTCPNCRGAYLEEYRG